MSELKTLKDIEYNLTDKIDDYTSTGCFSKELKAEAVKWIKKYGIYNLDEFLNITGEDLKDENNSSN